MKILSILVSGTLLFMLASCGATNSTSTEVNTLSGTVVTETEVEQINEIQSNIETEDSAPISSEADKKT
jgi:hypothetical protein